MGILSNNLNCSVWHGVSAISMIAAMGLVSPAQAQTGSAPQTSDAPGIGALAEVIVTAERRTTSAQKTAAAVTVQDGGEMLQRGKFRLTNILETVPSVSGGESEGVSNQPTGNDTPAAGITIRGVQTNGALAGQTAPGITATALYADGVYGGLGGSYDVDRVEVLRGPQGTLYGRSATAGVVSIHTRNPSLTDLSAEGSVEVGNLGLDHEAAAVNVPIMQGKVGLRVSGNHYERDGVDSKKGYGATRTTEAKAKLLFQPADSFSLLLGGALQDRRYNNGGVVGNLVTPDTFSYATPSKTGAAFTESRQVWVQADWDLGAAKLTYLPAYRTWKQNAVIYAVGPGGSIIRQTVTTPKDQFLTQELRLSSNADSDIKWQTGVFYYQNLLSSQNKNEWDSSNNLLFNADLSRKTYNLGVFAEATFPITSRFRVTGGLRYDKTTVKTDETYDSNINALCYTTVANVNSCPAAPAGSPLAGSPLRIATITVGGSAGKRVFENVSYKARLEYDLSPTNLLYGSASSAFLPGDVQVGTGPGRLPAVSVYESEKLTAYEVGSKNRFLDQRLQVNFGAFYYDYEGYQVSILLSRTDPGSGVLYNVPMRMFGQELEALFQVTSADRIGFNLSHIDAPFHDVPTGFARSASQTELWNFPPTSGTLSYQHDFALTGGSTVKLYGEGIWRAGYDVQPTSAALAAQGGVAYVHQEAFFQGNINATWTSADGRFSLTGYVRNVTDYRYKTYVNLQTVTPLQATGTQSDPRTFGAVLSARF